jgi:hypothetical protein
MGLSLPRLPKLNGSKNLLMVLAGAGLAYIGLSMLSGSKKAYSAAYGPWGSADYGYPSQESDKWDIHDWGVTRNDEIEYMNNQIPAFSWDVYNPKSGVESSVPDDIMSGYNQHEEKTSVKQKMKNRMKGGHMPLGAQEGHGAPVSDYGGMGGGYGGTADAYSNEGIAIQPRVWGGRSRTASALAEAYATVGGKTMGEIRGRHLGEIKRGKAYFGGQTAFMRGNQPLAFPGDPTINPMLSPKGQPPFPDRVTSAMAMAYPATTGNTASKGRDMGDIRGRHLGEIRRGKAYYGSREMAAEGYRGSYPSDPSINPYLSPKYFADMKYLGTKPVNNLDYRSPSTFDPSTPDFGGAMDY